MGNTDWADMGAFQQQTLSSRLPLDFAKGELTLGLNETQTGKGNRSGLRVSGHFFGEQGSSDLKLGLEITNQTGQQLTDFDIMFKKNPFSISVAGA